MIKFLEFFIKIFSIRINLHGYPFFVEGYNCYTKNKNKCKKVLDIIEKS